MLTLGHGRLDREHLAEVLDAGGITEVIDVRRFPGSRTNPSAAQGAIPDLLAELGLGYRWDERLGGRRALSAEQMRESPDSWWQVPAFRAYAAWTRSPDFRAALPELLQAPSTAALMCSESVWWRCHRRLIADVLTLEFGCPTRHLMHDGRIVKHTPSAGARLGDDSRVVWDAAGSQAALACSPAEVAPTGPSARQPG